MEEGLGQLAGEQWLGKVPEELLDHVGHVVGRLVLVAHEVRGRLALLPQGLDTRLHPGLPEQADLRVKSHNVYLFIQRHSYIFQAGHFVQMRLSAKHSSWMSIKTLLRRQLLPLTKYHIRSAWTGWLCETIHHVAKASVADCSVANASLANDSLANTLLSYVSATKASVANTSVSSMLVPLMLAWLILVGLTLVSLMLVWLMLAWLILAPLMLVSLMLGCRASPKWVLHTGGGE